MSDQPTPRQVLLDALVYAPAGLVLTVVEELPQLADKGRRRIEGRITTARVVGQFAVQFARQQVAARRAGEGGWYPRMPGTPGSGRPRPATGESGAVGRPTHHGGQAAPGPTGVVDRPTSTPPGAGGPSPAPATAAGAGGPRSPGARTAARGSSRRPGPAGRQRASGPARSAGGQGSAGPRPATGAAERPAPARRPAATRRSVPTPEAPEPSAPSSPEGSGRPAGSSVAAAAPSADGDGGVLGIPGYDSLSASQVVQRLAGLTERELQQVRRYESSGRHRRTILNRVEQLLGGTVPVGEPAASAPAQAGEGGSAPAQAGEGPDGAVSGSGVASRSSRA